MNQRNPLAKPVGHEIFQRIHLFYSGLARATVRQRPQLAGFLGENAQINKTQEEKHGNENHQG